MKREDLVIEDIPDQYQVYDVDLTPSGQLAVVLGHRTDRTRPVFVRWRGTEIPLPDDSLWWDEYRNCLCLSPLVRASDEFLTVVKPLARSDRENNGWLWNRSGAVEAAFHAGDNVEELLASDDLMLLFYGDEGQTGDISLSREAMVVMSSSGETLWGHRTQFGGKECFDTWFHAAVWEGRDDIAVFADVQHKCAFVRLNVRGKSQQVWRPPGPIASPDAVTTVGDKVIAHGSGLIDEKDGQGMLQLYPKDAWVRELVESGLRREHIYEWIPGTATWQVVGEWPWQVTNEQLSFRGLASGRFIAPKPDGYTILSFD